MFSSTICHDGEILAQNKFYAVTFSNCNKSYWVESRTQGYEITSAQADRLVDRILNKEYNG